MHYIFINVAFCGSSTGAENFQKLKQHILQQKNLFFIFYSLSQPDDAIIRKVADYFAKQEVLSTNRVWLFEATQHLDAHQNIAHDIEGCIILDNENALQRHAVAALLQNVMVC